MAHKVGCNPSYMSDIRTRKADPLKIIQAIADLHQMRLSKLLWIAEEKYRKGKRENESREANEPGTS